MIEATPSTTATVATVVLLRRNVTLPVFTVDDEVTVAMTSTDPGHVAVDGEKLRVVVDGPCGETGSVGADLALSPLPFTAETSNVTGSPAGRPSTVVSVTGGVPVTLV